MVSSMSMLVLGSMSALAKNASATAFAALAEAATFTEPAVRTQDWRGDSHVDPWSHVTLAAQIGLALFAALLVIGLLRALFVHTRLRAVGVLSAAEIEGLRARIGALERDTSGELAVVVLERSDDHPQAAWLAALSVWLCGSALLAPLLPWNEPALVIASQLVLLGVGYGLARLLPGFLQLFISDRRADRMSDEQALQEFARLELHATESRTGTLLFVSLLEREVVVLGDRGIDARVGAEGWAGAHAAILDGIRAGSLARGLEGGVDAIGKVLREQFPASGAPRNELPDHVIVRGA